MLSGSDGGDIVISGIGRAVTTRRDDAGSSERSGRQQSENGDLHGSGRLGSRSVLVVERTRIGRVPGWKV